MPELSVVKIETNSNSPNNKKMGTSIFYSCPERNYYFDYSVGNNFTSFYTTVNINSINVTCNQDRYDVEDPPIQFILCSDFGDLTKSEEVSLELKYV